MDLGFFSSGDPEKDLIKKLRAFAGEIEHKFQQRRGDDIGPDFLNRIHEALHKLDRVTKSHIIKNKISRLDTIITAARFCFRERQYEDYVDRVKVIADRLNDL